MYLLIDDCLHILPCFYINYPCNIQLLLNSSLHPNTLIPCLSKSMKYLDDSPRKQPKEFLLLYSYIQSLLKNIGKYDSIIQGLNSCMQLQDFQILKLFLKLLLLWFTVQLLVNSLQIYIKYLPF